MAPSRDGSGRGRKKTQLVQLDGETDEEYRRRRDRNNEAVRRSRSKTKKKTEETLKRVEVLKLENRNLEGQIKVYRDELAKLKDAFLQHAASGKISRNIDIEALLRESDDILEVKDFKQSYE